MANRTNDIDSSSTALSGAATQPVYEHELVYEYGDGATAFLQLVEK